MRFQEEMEALLQRHLLNGLVDAPWVRTDDPESDDDDRFFAALQELVAYAFEESVRIKKTRRLFSSWHELPARSSRGILQEVQSLLQKYRTELVRQSHVRRDIAALAARNRHHLVMDKKPTLAPSVRVSSFSTNVSLSISM